jgi:hypothetical protein
MNNLTDDGAVQLNMPPAQDYFYQLKKYFKRYYKIVIVILVLGLNFALFNPIYAHFFLRVGKTVYIGSIQAEEQAGNYWVDKHGETRFDGQETYQLVGWTFPQEMGLPLKDYQKQVVLIDDHSTGYYFDLMPVVRADVTRAFKDIGANVDDSGWLVNISKYVLPKGRYNLALLFTPPDHSSSILVRTNYYLTRTANVLKFAQDN